MSNKRNSATNFSPYLTSWPVLLAGVWVLGTTIYGAWLHGNSFYSGLSWALVYGISSAVMAVGAVYLLFRNPAHTMAAFIVSLTLALVVGGVLGPTIPGLREGTAVSTTPVSLSVEELQQRPPVLPAHVQLRGHMLIDLTIFDTYTARLGGGGNLPRIEQIYHTPVVGSNWQPGDPVQVVTTAQPAVSDYLETTADGQQIIEGILFPVVTAEGKSGWPFQRGETGTVSWYQSNAQFNFNPDTLLILDAVSPLALQLPFYVAVLILAVGAVILIVVLRRQSTQSK